MNDQEHERVAVSAELSERAMREVHLMPFHIAIKESKPGAIMKCYNKVNGVHLKGRVRMEWPNYE